MSAIKPTTYQVQVKIFEAAGCRYVRTQGDHLVYSYPETFEKYPHFVIPAKAGIQKVLKGLDSCFRRGDKKVRFSKVSH